MNFFDYISFIFFIWLMLPHIKREVAKQRRQLLMKAIEKKRSSKVITLVHQFSAISFLGMLMGEYITIDDAQKILKIVRETPADKPIDLLVHTPGGLVLASDQIAQALAKHKGKVTIIVPHYALSGGTYLALAADEIIMDRNAVLGRVDPQIFNFPAASVQKIKQEKNIDEIKDRTLVMADLSEKAMSQSKKSLTQLLKASKHENEKIEKIITELASGKYTHDYPLSFEETKKLGLNVTSEMPAEFYQLLELYPQDRRRRSSVQSVPNAKPDVDEKNLLV